MSKKNKNLPNPDYVSCPVEWTRMQIKDGKTIITNYKENFIRKPEKLQTKFFVTPMPKRK